MADRQGALFGRPPGRTRHPGTERGACAGMGDGGAIHRAETCLCSGVLRQQNRTGRAASMEKRAGGAGGPVRFPEESGLRLILLPAHGFSPHDK
ncbi:hypothetical protein [Acetobacter oeni]|uniref:hypothetical protein n=1 Tax=Acetobacter oeni TaxID=304077 RepID=UPI0011BEA082|nr:hypothetical protein [Acetobacter oeni]MBB3882822.1 hypothetical protein [Acetobacter oeni]NHO18911.1 hypothetical protein [Acetobacter oeni]